MSVATEERRASKVAALKTEKSVYEQRVVAAAEDEKKAKASGDIVAEASARAAQADLAERVRQVDAALLQFGVGSGPVKRAEKVAKPKESAAK